MTSVAPAHRVEPPMTHTPDPATTSQAQTVDDAVAERPARPRLRDQIAENPLASLAVGLVLGLFTLLGTVAMGLLFFTLNDISDGLDDLGERVDRVEASLGDRIDRLEAKVDVGFAAQGAQIAELDARLTGQIAELDARLTGQIAELDARLTGQIAELDRKLTALIAHLNATEAVDAALEHRLLIPRDSAPEPKGEPSS